MKYVFIINPTSGNDKGIEVGKVIEEYCKTIKVDYKIIYTNNKMDAKNIALTYKSYENAIIFSVGGDGTLNEVVNGLANSKSKLGIIPVGTGNDFYRVFKDFSGDKIDLGKVNDRYFINVASLGLDAEMAEYANKLKKIRFPKKLVYPVSIIKEFLSYKPTNIGMNNIFRDITILTVCNGRYYGGGFEIAPNALLNDGMFDIIDVNSLNRLEIINLIMKLMKVKHLDSKNVSFYRTDNLKITSLTPLICNIDGETIKDYNFDFTIKKEALNIDINTSLKISEILKQKKLIK